MSQMRGPKAGAVAVRLFFGHNGYKGRRSHVIFVRPVIQRLLLSLNRFSRWLKGNRMSEILIILAIVLVWLLLQVYVLPKLGIST